MELSKFLPFKRSQSINNIVCWVNKVKNYFFFFYRWFPQAWMIIGPFVIFNKFFMTIKLLSAFLLFLHIMLCFGNLILVFFSNLFAFFSNVTCNDNHHYTNMCPSSSFCFIKFWMKLDKFTIMNADNLLVNKLLWISEFTNS